MRKRYAIYFYGNENRPYYVYDNLYHKTVATYKTLANAKAKYPNADDYATLLSEMRNEVGV